MKSSDEIKRPVSNEAEFLETDLTRKLTVVEIYDSYTPGYAAEVERKLVRKIDLRILPLLVVIYIFNYLDRNSITQARLYGLQEDTGVHGPVYQTAISIFSAGYIIMQLPATLMMTKLRPSIYLVSHLALDVLCRFTNSKTAQLHHCLGCCLGMYRGHEFSCWTTNCSVFPGNHRSTVLPWR